MAQVPHLGPYLIKSIATNGYKEPLIEALNGPLRRRLGLDCRCHVENSTKVTVTFSSALPEQAHK